MVLWEKNLCKPYTKWPLSTNKDTTQNELFFKNLSSGGYWIRLTWSGEYAFIGKHPEWGTIKPDLFSSVWFFGCAYKARLAQWWKHPPSSNVAQAWFPDLLSYVDWVCWFSTLFVEVFPGVLPLSHQNPTFDLICSDSVWFSLLN